MKFFNSKKRIIAAAATAALVVGVGGGAFAYFTSQGDGGGSASVGSATPWGVSVTSDATNTILPGSGSETLTYTITNNSAGAQALTAVTATVKDDGTANHNVLDHGAPVVGCLASWFHASAGASTPAAGASIAHLGTATGSVTVTMDDAAASQDACQGITGPDVNVHAA